MTKRTRCNYEARRLNAPQVSEFVSDFENIFAYVQTIIFSQGKLKKLVIVDSIIIGPREFHFLSIQNIFKNFGRILAAFNGGSYLWLYGCYDRITHRPKARTNC